MDCLNWESNDNNKIKIISKYVKKISINVFVTLSICDLPLIFFMTDNRYRVNVSKNSYFFDIIINVSTNKCGMMISIK